MGYLPRKFRKGDPVRAADLNAMDEEIRRLGQVSVGGGLTLHNGPNGFTFGMKSPMYVVSAVAASGGISAAPDADTLGEGDAVLRYRRGADLVDGPTVKVYSNFTVTVPEATRIEVAPDGADYKLVGADCPPE